MSHFFGIVNYTHHFLGYVNYLLTNDFLVCFPSLVDLNEFRESRKRTRRQSQHSMQSKSSDRSSSKGMQNLSNSYDYETMSTEQAIKPSLSPESKYLNSYCYAPNYEPMERRDGSFYPNAGTLEKNPHGKNNLMSSSSKYPYKYTIDFNEDKRDLDDRFSKHSDSGYDTLRTPAKMLPADPEVSDLLKFRFDREQAYSVQRAESPKHNAHIDNYDANSDPEWTFRNEGPADLYEFLKAEASAGNLVQNRIKEFEPSPEKCETKDRFELQEPLKLSSSYHSNEAHVSYIKSNESSPEKSNLKKKSEVHMNGLPQRNPVSMEGEEARYAVKRDIKNQNPKSVKDLLADFEKKSQLLKEQSEAEAKIIEESSNRYVFSDTETLLYDTSSDHELADERILNHVKKTEPPLSEDDEEVAAALGKQESFFSACRDIGRKSDKVKRKNSKSSLGESSTNTDLTIGYNRLSIAESMVTHDDIESHRSFPREKEQLNRTEDDNTSIEEHYMPMTPSKKNVLSPSTEMFVVHSRNNSATHSAIMEDLLTTFEESSYVEMTENGLSKSLLAPKTSNSFASKNNLKRNNSLNSSNYCEIDNKAESHYDVLYTHLPNGTVQNRLYFNPPQPAKHFANQPRRPKSSMEFIDNDFDGSFWSEENYARKMRQSAIYVSPPASQRATTPSSKHLFDDGPNADPCGTLGENRMTASLHRDPDRKWSSGYHGDQPSKYFQRSASARLPRTTTPDDDEEVELVSMVNSQTSSRDGSERKSVGSDLDSIGSRNGLAVTDSESIDFDQYLEDLQVNHNLDFSNLASKNFDYDKKMTNGYREEQQDVKLRYNMDSQQSFYSQTSSQSAAYDNKESSASKDRSPRHIDEVHYENLNAMYNSPPPPLPPAATSLIPPPRPPSYSHTLERRREQQSLATSSDNETYERLRREYPGDKRPGCNTLPVHHGRQDSTVGIVREEPVQNYQIKHPVASTSYEGASTSSSQEQRSNQREQPNVNNRPENHAPGDDNILGAPYYYSDLLKEQEDNLVSDNSASNYPNNSKNYTNPIPRSARNTKLNNQRDNKADIIAA
ncbi:uncharacterized protein LOC113466308 [Diaphorina citri]|uniref:Uncharacterized protein LOC113466308 n=1 Tax=Diaphorina citri TaxID=121845 RepID=A0A3Q0IMF2_DIACI|nr:uncharacterized protein LOC113466308 [Diaphorina citri]